MGFLKRIILVGGCLLCLSAPGWAQVLDRIIAVVNDDIITLYEFNTAFEPYLKNIESTYPGKDKEQFIRQTREAFLQRMVDNILIEQEAKRTGISATVKDEDVMNVLQDMLDRQKISMQDFLKKIAREGGSLESVKKDIRSQLIRMRILRREVKDKVIVTEDEIGAYYNKHRSEYEGKESVRIKQLMLPFPANADNNTKEKIKHEAEMLRERVIKGEPFDLLVAKYSKGPAVDQGGDVGFIEKGVIIPEVEAVAFSLPLDKLSPVIVSDMGVHIIQVIDKRGAGLKPIAEVREEIRSKIEEEKLENKFEEWIASVRSKSHIEFRL
ncbi:MAG TPA: peptidylprolyl isomerase [Smithella sp.]|nr:peptidylprolyl isomerase [Smithella sp.]